MAPKAPKVKKRVGKPKGRAKKRSRKDPLAALAGLSEAEKRQRLLQLLKDDCVDDDSEDAADDDWQMPDLDVDGRTAAAGPEMKFDYSQSEVTFGRPEALAHLVKTCRMVHALGGSSWLACGSKPRCLAERVAEAVFEHHARGANYDPQLSGAEWWAQVRQGGHAEEGIQFHWDTDEIVVERHGVNIHPHLATVTYLTDIGAPTLAVDCRNPRKAASLEEAYGSIRRGLLTHPRIGKHIVFDGQLLHGTVPRPGEVGERVTFLVNIWLNHRPSSCRPLPEDLAAHFAKMDGTAEATAGSVELAPSSAPASQVCSSDETVFETTFSRRGVLYSTLRVPLPASCDTAVLHWPEGHAELKKAEQPIST
eukprot:TRINITY_DN12067_c0_g3_i1.p1 TRINITY_DN12067_c0_g3~~TRINITY_DN12067_c0_g3_i1.p1  ORF type:complete len:386 (+),score=75.23 TRINITY_DN12067_c0_g3_i1:65-1159(+)